VGDTLAHFHCTLARGRRDQVPYSPATGTGEECQFSLIQRTRPARTDNRFEHRNRVNRGQPLRFRHRFPLASPRCPLLSSPLMTTTLSYAHGTSLTPLLGDTIGENLRRTVERFPDRDALVVCHQNYRASYRQLWDAVAEIARGLLALGVQKGERVGIWSP